MKKDKKIKELDDWLSNVSDTDLFDDDVKIKTYDDIILDSDFDSITRTDNNIGEFEYKSNGVQDYVLNKLKKKKVSEIDMIIDLHGETIKESITKLNEFFSKAYTNNIKYIQIICGKGKNSVDSIPRIKLTTQCFIKKSKIVNAACSANSNEGGIGVIKVKLKN